MNSLTMDKIRQLFRGADAEQLAVMARSILCDEEFKTNDSGRSYIRRSLHEPERFIVRMYTIMGLSNRYDKIKSLCSPDSAHVAWYLQAAWPSVPTLIHYRGWRVQPLSDFIEEMCDKGIVMQ